MMQNHDLVFTDRPISLGLGWVARGRLCNFICSQWNRALDVDFETQVQSRGERNHRTSNPLRFVFVHYFELQAVLMTVKVSQHVTIVFPHRFHLDPATPTSSTGQSKFGSQAGNTRIITLIYLLPIWGAPRIFPIIMESTYLNILTTPARTIRSLLELNPRFRKAAERIYSATELSHSMSPYYTSVIHFLHLHLN